MKNILEISFNTKTFLRYLHPRREDKRGVDVNFHLFFMVTTEYWAIVLTLQSPLPGCFW